MLISIENFLSAINNVMEIVSNFKYSRAACVMVHIVTSTELIESHLI